MTLHPPTPNAKRVGRCSVYHALHSEPGHLCSPYSRAPRAPTLGFLSNADSGSGGLGEGEAGPRATRSTAEAARDNSRDSCIL